MTLLTHTPSLAAFARQGPPPAPPGGNTPWAGRYGQELTAIVRWHAENSPRNLQRRLGPSELGHDCDRQVVGKMAGQPTTNHVVDPWPSVVGTAVHAWMDEAFTRENERSGPRWLPERRVQPWPGAEGRADLYDARWRAVVDHKNLGNSTHAKLVSKGAPVHYTRQLKLYGLGYRNAGLPVDRIVIAAWPRTGSSLGGLYVWEHTWTSADDEELAWLYRKTAERATVAQRVHEGQVSIRDVPVTPDSDTCYFCPFYRPQAAHDASITGCPGTAS